MGQSASVSSRSEPGRRPRSSAARQSFSDCAATMGPEDGEQSSVTSDSDRVGQVGRDSTVDLPDECLAMVFQFLGPPDRSNCSLVCKRWLVIEGQSRHRISLDARAVLLEAIPRLFSRFDAVTKLALKCERRSDSIGDEGLALISARCPNLTRLKIRACREVSEEGMTSLAKNCPRLRKLSCGSCTFGSRGINAVLAHCPLLEELSIKRLRGITDEPVGGSALFRCSGDWDKLFEELPDLVPGLVEVHLEKINISDRGLYALSSCIDLEVLHLVRTTECTNAGLAFANRIGDEGLAAVARRCPNLQELVLIGVNPTAQSLGLIAGNCRNLERLALCGSETIGDAEIFCIAAKCVALKKLCIKGCPVSNHGMEALAGGCPNLVKVKVKKCKAVTADVAEWLKTIRGSLAVNLDSGTTQRLEQLDASTSESGLRENAPDHAQLLVEQMSGMDLPSSSGGRSAMSKARWRFISARNFMASTLRRLSQNGSSAQHHP
ncbi:unnamed protein product [Spirodela intermedia]|uniref:F-box domain-containing protein n=1 Tax=Spirodela intermedia TaxID=51605 RepID=A0A7I8JR02_SPIIN|nr:unnamed protein product [Spirodela intermedia]CAA6672588.1 unnamed protein product [Spirodela intermedia]